MRFASLASGSAGNCMVIEHGSTRLLLDCGLGPRDLASRLISRGLDSQQITGIILTHEHDDHAKGAFKFAAFHNIPIWLSHGTRVMVERYLPEGLSLDLRVIDSHQPFQIRDMEVAPYPVPHDAREPTQFVFSDGQHTLGVLTDTGVSTPHIESMLTGCDALVLECNHDLEMLKNGPYSPALKKRVGGRLGHLDNGSAARLLANLDNRKLKHIIAAHLSAKNNTPELAQAALAAVLNCSREWIGIANQVSGFDWRSL
ncbi:MAG TPA: MBL fold metallo-hydrolase [Methylophilus sp.]|nr:MBL fold metallo-hydrolase [Methylophilus sp.]HQQ34040.1 MBL fold metallo-hydrolase [Methylophilus sp.]